MLSNTDYDNLKIGDVVSVRGTKATIFYFEKGTPPIPIGILDSSACFGVVCPTGTTNSLKERLKELVKAGYDPNSKTFRLFQSEIESIVSKKDNLLKKLAKEDLPLLKINDAVVIDGIEFDVKAIAINGIQGPWIKAFNEKNSIFPCTGSCHSIVNKNLNLPSNQKYQALMDLFIFEKKDIYLKNTPESKGDNNAKTNSPQPSIEIKPEIDSKEKIMIEENKTNFVDIVRSDTQEAAYRTAAKKGVRALRAAILRVAKDKGADRKEVNYLRKAFESSLGEAVLSMALGYMLTYAPLPGVIKNNKHFDKIVGELRIGGIQIGMDAILTEAMGYIGPMLDEIKNLLPEDNENIAAILPARIAKPATKRIKTSHKEDQDDLGQEDLDDEVEQNSKKKTS